MLKKRTAWSMKQIVPHVCLTYSVQKHMLADLVQDHLLLHSPCHCHLTLTLRCQKLEQSITAVCHDSRWTSGLLDWFLLSSWCTWVSCDCHDFQLCILVDLRLFQPLHVHILLKETIFVRMEVFNKDGKDEWFKVLLIVVLQCDHIPTGKLNFRLSSSLTVFRSQIIV